MTFKRLYGIQHISPEAARIILRAEGIARSRRPIKGLRVELEEVREKEGVNVNTPTVISLEVLP